MRRSINGTIWLSAMLDGRFVPLGEDWNCDECSATIRSSLYAFVFERGQDAGRCLCIRCVTDPDFDGGGEFLAAWGGCPGNTAAYRAKHGEPYPSNVEGLAGHDHDKDGMGPGPKSYELDVNTRYPR